MDNLQQLYEIAKMIRLNAYAPYSEFKVGAAVITDENKIYSGCNVENISFPCGTCAEAGAISAMVADGQKHIKEILIVADSDNITPCGNCLQKIAEFKTKSTLIHCADLHGNIKTYKLSDLLPQIFNTKEIKHA